MSDFSDITDLEIDLALSWLIERKPRAQDPLAGQTRRCPGATRVLANVCKLKSK